MKDQLKQIIIPWAKTLSFPVRVYFFGSRSRNNPKSKSDLDIAVQPLIPEMDTTDRRNKVYDIENKLDALLHKATGFQIHVVYYDGRDDTTLGQYLKKEGCILWEPDNGKD